jgi:hypothetical protein
MPVSAAKINRKFEMPEESIINQSKYRSFNFPKCKYFEIYGI